MKQTALILMLLVSLAAKSQKITVSVDKYLKKTTIQSKREWLRSSISAPLEYYFRSVGSTVYVVFIGARTGAFPIGESDRMILLFKNQDTLSINPTSGIQSYRTAGYGMAWDHSYVLDEAAMKKMISSPITSARKYGTEGYVEFEMTDKNAEYLQQVAKKFLEIYRTEQQKVAVQ